MAKKKQKLQWRTEQPPENGDIIVFLNAAKPSYYFIKWCKVPDTFHYNNDWDIELCSGFYVGPQNFEGGGQFVPDVKDKEFYWMPREEFFTKTKGDKKWQLTNLIRVNKNVTNDSNQYNSFDF